MKSFTDFSHKIGIDSQYLRSIADNHSKLYRTVRIPKRNGSYRILSVPNQELKAIQRWIVQTYLIAIPISDRAHGFCVGRGIRTNATVHKNRRFILNIDIKDFFPSIKSPLVTQVFKEHCGFDDSASKIISQLCTLYGSLPQGAPTSPHISNIVMQDFDREVTEICNGQLIAYTRYADDLSFSASSLDKLRPLLPLVERSLSLRNMELNKPKTRTCSPGKSLNVTGIKLNNGGFSIGRDKKRKLRAMIHHFIKKGEGSRNQILGHLSFLHDIEPARYNEFLTYIQKLSDRAGSQK